MRTIEFQLGGDPKSKGSYFGRITGWPNKRWNKAAREKAMRRILGMIHKGEHPIVDIIPTVKGLEEWESKVRKKATEKMFGEPGAIEGACRVYIVFYLKRPQNHFGRKDGKPYIKDRFKNLPCTKVPDIDKLTRSIFDAMNKVVYNDDSQVVDMCCRKLWGTRPGVYVKIEEISSKVVSDMPELNQMLFNFEGDQ